MQSLAQNSSQRHFAQFDTSSITSPGLSEPRTIAGRQSADYPSSQAKHKRPIHHRKAASVAGVEQLTLGQNVEFDSSVWASSAEEQARLPSRKQADLIDLSSGVDDPWRASNLSSPDRPRLSIQTGREHLGEGQPSVRRVPSIVLTGEDGSVTPVRQASHSSTSSSEGSHYVVAASRPWSLPTWAQSSDRKAQTRRIAIALWRNLLPSLHEFRQKSYLGAAAGILSAPAILALNLTLPVVDEASFDDSFSDAEEKAYREAQDESFDDYEEDEEPIEEEERALWRERTRKRDERIAHRLHSPAAPSHDSSTGDSPVDLSRVDARLSAATGSSGFPWSPNTPAGDAHEDSGPTEPPPSPRGGEKQRKTDVRVEKVLTILQCALCPFFCVVALLGGSFENPKNFRVDGNRE